MNLDCILHNPAIANSNVHFVPADTYDFHLENTLDMKVLMKKFKLGSKHPRVSGWRSPTPTAPLVPSLAARSPANTATACRMMFTTAHCVGAGGQSLVPSSRAA